MKKKIPNSLFPLMGKRRPLMAVFVACMAANGVWAQEESSWVGEPLPAEGGEFYLYNKEGGGFLLGANPLAGIRQKASKTGRNGA